MRDQSGNKGVELLKSTKIGLGEVKKKKKRAKRGRRERSKKMSKA